MSIEEEWEPATTNQTVGDALKHTLTIKGAGIPAMAIPPIRFKTPAGISNPMPCIPANLPDMTLNPVLTTGCKAKRKVVD